MKFFTLNILLLFTFLQVFSQKYSVSNFAFDPPFPDTLFADQKVNFTFDYHKIGGDIRIYYYPVGSGRGGASTSGSPLYTDNDGKAEGFFTMNNDSKITALRIYFKETVGTQLFDTTVTIDYTYIGFNIDDLVLDPPSPAALSIGDSVKFTFNYTKPDIDVIIAPHGYSDDDKIIAGQVSPKTPVLTGTSGSSSGYIKINKETTLDIMQFQFIDASNNDTLYERRQSMYYTFSNDTARTYSISNVVFDPPSPSVLKVGDTLDINFDYTKAHGGVRIYGGLVITDGNGNTAESGSILYTDNKGKGTYRFYLNGEMKIEKVILRIVSNYMIELHRHEEEVLYSVVTDPNNSFKITNVQFTPPPPIEVNTVDTIKFTFDYQAPFSGVKIFARPFENGKLKEGYFAADSPLFTEKTGSGNGYIIYPQPSTFDQVRFQFQSAFNQVIYETFVDAKYTITVRPVFSEMFSDEQRLSVYPNPASEKVFIEVSGANEFSYQIISLAGQVVDKGVSEKNKIGIDINKFGSGTYITQVILDGKQYSKLLIFE